VLPNLPTSTSPESSEQQYHSRTDGEGPSECIAGKAAIIIAC